MLETTTAIILEQRDLVSSVPQGHGTTTVAGSNPLGQSLLGCCLGGISLDWERASIWAICENRKS
jgi:hypothetical protein